MTATTPLITGVAAPPSASPAAPLAANEWGVRVGFADVDQMRVAHHARYWPWFEEARFHFLRTVLHLDVDEIVATGVYTPLVHSECRYLRAVRWGDSPIVRVRLVLPRSARLTFTHDLIDAHERSRVFARARTTHVFTDHDMRLLCTIPAPYEARFRVAVRECPEAFLESDAPHGRPTGRPSPAHA
jgi:acyl-CoA thioester hydrolase